ncbi:MAG: pyrroline-5-carboxylate reductase [Pseudomonas sp.]|uniref:pyrroline-5-carboxylate reductase n=1 Tax=Pseudomonas sp. TaxID=306 RepID=UPI0033947024
MSDTRISFIGAGNMAASLIGGLRSQGFAANALRASDPGSEQRARISAEYGIEVFAENAQAVEAADLVVLSIKPQAMKSVCLALAAHLQPGQLVVSIAAGITIDSLQRWLAEGASGPRAIVRCMPNTPALVGVGASGLYANEQVSDEQRQQAEQLLRAVGLALWLENEQQLDAVTAVSGSGPAYFFLLIEAMTAAGEHLGLSREVAAQLTLQTALGAAQMASRSDVDASELRRRVTSPGGTTEAAINALQQADFQSLVAQALEAAARRSAQLAVQLGE